jgi:hypothetical protein
LVKASFDVRGADFEGGSNIRYMASKVLPESFKEENLSLLNKLKIYS